MKKVAFATACLVLLVLSASGAWANSTGPQVTLSKGTVGYYSFWNPGPAIDVSLTGTTAGCGHPNCTSGSAILDEGNGNITGGMYWMWFTGGPATLSGGPTDYTANMAGSTLFMQIGLGPHGNGSLGMVYGTVVLTDLTGGSTATPKFDGIFTVLSSTGLLGPLFNVGGVTSMDFTVNLGPAKSFNPILHGPTIDGYVSSGELLPTPEPGTLALMGTGILSLAGVIRRKLR